LERLGFRLWDDSLNLRDETGTRRILAGLRDFQEHLGGELTITLLAGIGQGVEVHAMDDAAIQQSIEWLRARSRSARER
jgi:3-dehydroquinate synthase